MLGGMIAGGLPARRVDQWLSPSDALPPPPPSNVFTGPLYVVGPKGGLFLYNPTVGLNNLVASGSAIATTDHGNQVIPGWSAYAFAGGTIQQYASLQAGVLQLGGGPPGGYVAIPTIGVSNGLSTLFLTSGQRVGGVDGGFAALFLTTGAPGHAGYALLTDQTTLLVAGAGPPQTLAGVEVANVNGNGYSAQALAGAGPASVAGYGYWYVDQFTQWHSDRAIQCDVNVETKNLGASPGAGGSGAKSWSSSGHRQIQAGQAGIGGDGLNYDVERLTLLTSGQLVNSASGVTVTGLTKALGVGTYKISGSVTYQSNQADAANTPQFGFSMGGTVTQGYYNSEYTVRTNNNTSTSPLTNFNNVGFDTLASTHKGPAYVNAQFVEFTFRGTLTVSVAGTFTMQAKTSLAADTFTTQAGGWMEIQPVVAT